VGRTEQAGREATPETYLGSARAQGWVPGPPRNGTRIYRAPASLEESRFALDGTWRVGQESATAVRDATLQANVVGKGVYLVLSSRDSTPRRLVVELDGNPIRAADAGPDVHGGHVTVRQQRLYRLVQLDATERHRLTLRFAPGISGYAFTFG
jgi:Thioredoxin like C-terminal domain